MCCVKQQNSIVVNDEGDSTFEFTFGFLRMLLLDNICMIRVKYPDLRGGESLRYGPQNRSIDPLNLN